MGFHESEEIKGKRTEKSEPRRKRKGGAMRRDIGSSGNGGKKMTKETVIKTLDEKKEKQDTKSREVERKRKTKEGIRRKME